MSWFRRAMGLDAVDTTIHLVATGFIAGVAGAASTSNTEGVVMLVFAASTILFGVRRQRALKRQALMPETTGEVAALRVDDLESRVSDLEAAQQRVLELEERLDFAERLLARQQDVARLSPPGA